jgi:hypothetical protein
MPKFFFHSHVNPTTTTKQDQISTLKLGANVCIMGNKSYKNEQLSILKPQKQSLLQQIPNN